MAHGRRLVALSVLLVVWSGDRHFVVSAAEEATTHSGHVASESAAPAAKETAQEAPKTAPSEHHPSPVPSSGEQLAGYIFDVPVSLNNYLFAKQVSYTFPQGSEDQLSGPDRERAIWEALILHYESFRRGVQVPEAELEQRVNDVLKSQHQLFTRAGDPTAYATWVNTTLNEGTELFENQMRYLLQIENLKEQVRRSVAVSVTEEEMHQEFLNEKNHVGGEMVTFETKEEAEAFYRQVKRGSRWEAMKAKGQYQVRPVSLMTLEAYMDLWQVPKEQLYAFHGMSIGSVGSPMPFGSKQWCVYRLLDKRTGDLKEFPKERDAYDQQLKVRKQYEGMRRWIEDLKTSAHLKVLPIS